MHKHYNASLRVRQQLLDVYQALVHEKVFMHKQVRLQQRSQLLAWRSDCLLTYCY